LRTAPTGLKKQFENVKIALSRFKAQESLVKDIDAFLKQAETFQSLGTLTVNRALTAIAEKQIEIFEGGVKFNAFIDKPVLETRAAEYIEGYTKLEQVADEGAETFADVINKIMFNKNDPKKVGKNILLNESLKFIGFAHKVIKNSNYFVAVLADKVVEKKRKTSGGNTDELKAAFDCFDVMEIGKIDPKETLNAMRALGYDVKNPTLYQIMAELDTPDNNKTLVDFETFVNHITARLDDTKTEEGVKRIFNLFIDDPTQDTITLATLRKICTQLGENQSVDELNDMLQRASGKGTELTFQEFYEYMKGKYGEKIPEVGVTEGAPEEIK